MDYNKETLKMTALNPVLCHYSSYSQRLIVNRIINLSVRYFCQNLVWAGTSQTKQQKRTFMKVHVLQSYKPWNYCCILCSALCSKRRTINLLHCGKTVSHSNSGGQFFQSNTFHDIGENRFVFPHSVLSCLYPRSQTHVSNGARCCHTSSKFSIQNPVFASYLHNLMEEYKILSDDFQDLSNNAPEENIQKMTLRLNFLRSVASVIEPLQKKQTELQELAKMIEVEEDKEMKAMIEGETEKYKEDMVQMEEELVDALVGEEPADNNDVVLEVSAGVGGQEAMLFCAEIFNMYYNYSFHKGWRVTEAFLDENEMGGTRRATAEISGEAVYKHMKHEAGVHRVQRVPKTEKAGRIHTSTITVSVLPQPREIDIDIQKKDLKIETFRGSGPGGQSVNTTDSAVRITHIPTGVVSECRQERSQLKNKDLALKNLKRKMYQSILEEEEIERRATRKMQMGTRSRSDKIRTYNFQQDRITDHRLKENCSNLSEFMSGGEGLDNVISSLNEMNKYQTLESMLEEYQAEMEKKKSGKR